MSDLIKYGSYLSCRSWVNLKEGSKLVDFILFFVKSLGDPRPCVAPKVSQRMAYVTKELLIQAQHLSLLIISGPPTQHPTYPLNIMGVGAYVPLYISVFLKTTFQKL